MHSGLFIFALLALESVTINLIPLFPLKIKLCICAHMCMHVHGMHMGVMCGVCTFRCIAVCTAETQVCLWRYM